MVEKNLVGNPGSEESSVVEESKVLEDVCDYDCCTKYLLSDLDVPKPSPSEGELVAKANLTSLLDIPSTTFRVLPDEQDRFDNRRSISNSDAKPWSAICSLKIITKRQGYFIGTGFFIGSRTILTAAHNVYNRAFTTSLDKKKFYAEKIEVYPGRYYDNFPFPTRGSGIAKPITVDLSKPDTVFVANSWLEYGAERDDYDYAILRISKPVGEQTGWLDLDVADDAFLRNRIVHLAGYPQVVRGDYVDGKLMYHAKDIVSDLNERMIYHQVDGTYGQSGSPIWYQGSDNKPKVIGIYTSDLMQSNVGIRITSEVRDRIQKFLI